mgnify:CR=1 FL=1
MQVHGLEGMYLYFEINMYKIQARADKVMTHRTEVLLGACYFLLEYDDLDKRKLAIICCLLF